MPLSKSTTDQIRKEAESVKSIDNDDHVPSLINGYIVGAMRWAVWKQKAAAASIERDNLLMDKEGLVKALKMIEQMEEPFNMKVIATAALEQLKKTTMENNINATEDQVATFITDSLNVLHSAGKYKMMDFILDSNLTVRRKGYFIDVPEKIQDDTVQKKVEPSSDVDAKSELAYEIRELIHRINNSVIAEWPESDVIIIHIIDELKSMVIKIEANDNRTY